MVHAHPPTARPAHVNVHLSRQAAGSAALPV